MCLGRIQEPCEFVLFLNQDSHIASDFNNVERNGRVFYGQVRKNIFSRSGNCQGILKFIREFWNLSRSQGKVREF